MLASGIVSTALQCGTGSSKCLTDDLMLDKSVLITIEHSKVNLIVITAFP